MPTALEAEPAPNAAGTTPRRRSQVSFLLPGAAVGLTVILVVAGWNPWHLTAVALLNRPRLGSVVVWLLLGVWLIFVERRPTIRQPGLAALATIGLFLILWIPLVAFFDGPPEGKSHLVMPGSDVIVVVDELSGIPGKRTDVVRLTANRGLASRENHATGIDIRTDLEPATLELVPPSTIVIHRCLSREVVEFDPNTLGIVSRTNTKVAAFGRRHDLPEGTLRLPFATPRSDAPDCIS